MTVLVEAFRRVGYQPAPIGAPRVKAKGRLLAELEAIQAMSDDELHVEMLSLNENVQCIHNDLHAESQGTYQPEDLTWRRRAEHALASLKARRGLVQREYERRAGEAKRQRKAESAERNREEGRDWEKVFVGLAREMLPEEQYAAIRNATTAEMAKRRAGVS